MRVCVRVCVACVGLYDVCGSCVCERVRYAWCAYVCACVCAWMCGCGWKIRAVTLFINTFYPLRNVNDVLRYIVLSTIPVIPNTDGAHVANVVCPWLVVGPIITTMWISTTIMSACNPACNIDYNATHRKQHVEIVGRLAALRVSQLPAHVQFEQPPHGVATDGRGFVCFRRITTFDVTYRLL